MKEIKAIISDADGTLVNTVYLIRRGQYEAAIEYLMARGIPRHEMPSYEVYENYVNKSVGGSTRETFEKTLQLLFRETDEHLLDKTDFDELDRHLEPIQDNLAPFYVHPFHGLTELFDWLGKTYTKFGIFTSGNRRMIIRNFGVCLPALGFSDLFRLDDIDVSERLEVFIARATAVYGIPSLALVTCEDVTKTKPDPEGILKLMDQLSLDPDEVVVLGDHAVDMQAASNAGLNAIGISHGFGTPTQLREAGAKRIIGDLSSLPRVIEEHNSGKVSIF